MSERISRIALSITVAVLLLSVAQPRIYARNILGFTGPADISARVDRNRVDLSQQSAVNQGALAIAAQSLPQGLRASALSPTSHYVVIDARTNEIYSKTARDSNALSRYIPINVADVNSGQDFLVEGRSGNGFYAPAKRSVHFEHLNLQTRGKLSPDLITVQENPNTGPYRRLLTYEGYSVEWSTVSLPECGSIALQQGETVYALMGGFGDTGSGEGSSLDIGMQYVAASNYFEPYVALPGPGGTETIFSGETGVKGPPSAFSIPCGTTVRMAFDVVPQSGSNNVNFVLVITDPNYSSGTTLCPPTQDGIYCTILQVITGTPSFYGWTAPPTTASTEALKRFTGLAQPKDSFLDNSTTGTVTWTSGLVSSSVPNTLSSWAADTTDECEAYPPYNDGSSFDAECYSSPNGNEPVTVDFSDYSDESDSIANVPDPPCTLDSYGHCAVNKGTTITSECNTGTEGPHDQPIYVDDTKTVYNVYSASVPMTVATKTITAGSSRCATITTSWSPAEPKVTYNDPNLP